LVLAPLDVIMKILLTGSCSDGIVLPMTPFAWALRTAGHEVLISGPPNMRPQVTGAGLPFAPYREPVTFPDLLRKDRDGRAQTMPAGGEHELLAHIGRGYGRLAGRTLDEALALTDAWRPDVVVGDPQGLVAGLVAGARELPWVRLGFSMGSPPVLDDSARAEVAPDLERLGLPALPDPALTLDVCPPSVRRPEQTDVTGMRYVPYNGTAVLPDWLLAPRRKPRVLLTLGTQVPLRGGLGMMGQLMKTLTAELGLEVVVAIDDTAAEELRPVPEGVVAVGRISLNMVLPTCDLIVHHSGSGTTMTSLVAGVPQMIVPVIAETWDYARRLDAFGVARRLTPQEADPDAVVAQCRPLLEDSSYRERAALLRDEIAALPSPGDLARSLPELIAGGAR
jgi:UDP:flavonoid glycosyltransferase YjiC (YdhE family)